MRNNFIIQIESKTLQKKKKEKKKENGQTLRQPKLWYCDNYLHQGYYATIIMTSWRLFRRNEVSRGTNQPIRKLELVVYEIE